MKQPNSTINIPSEYLAEIGRRGGKACGACKSRGDSKHYQSLVSKRKDRKK